MNITNENILNLLTLNDFEFRIIDVDEEKVKKYKNESCFIELFLEIFKEVGKMSSLISCIYPLDERNIPRNLNIDEGVIYGLMIRVTKLQRGIIEQVCNNHLEIVLIIFRCLVETLINIKYILKKINENEDIIDEFITYSLKTEKRLLNKIRENIKNRGYEIPIEKRMKNSIEKTFKISSFNLDEVDEKDKKTWGNSIRSRAKEVNLLDAYFLLFSIHCHSIHGNWQDILDHHIIYKNGEFIPKIDWSTPRSELLFVPAFISSDINKIFLENIIEDCDEKDKLINIINTQTINLEKAMNLHEEFMQK